MRPREHIAPLIFGTRVPYSDQVETRVIYPVHSQASVAIYYMENPFGNYLDPGA